ncbi:mini-ribonuclease 3 [Lactococcus hodotermopsidis]|uniref:Mini-ribonuclease 3 n=1 Tax=Pseudolactococcus hodotermopsidis TaxID=2709157 RepID=A0A6A0BBH1_9LACT|nr:Mini-ribonuclease 3 [Lactococcus hodotermopsidis]GFH42186.1 mini-ribonuclease 3 [Lactococcus hodotermopsidis]
MTEFRADLLNGIALAYAGDAIYEVFVRDYLLRQGITKAGELQKNAVKFVSAKAQAWLISEMTTDDYLTEEELGYFKRGRNAHSKTTAKNTDVVTYRISTGFEAVFGFNHLTGQKARVEEMASYCIRKISEQNF